MQRKKSVYAGEVGERLRKLRKNAGYTQAGLAKVMRDQSGCEVATSTISCWEKGHRLPTYELLCELTKALSTSTDYILGISA